MKTLEELKPETDVALLIADQQGFGFSRLLTPGFPRSTS